MAFRCGQNYTDDKNMLKTKYVSRYLQNTANAIKNMSRDFQNICSRTKNYQATVMTANTIRNFEI